MPTGRIDDGLNQRSLGQRSTTWDDPDGAWRDIDTYNLSVLHHHLGGNGLDNEATVSVIRYWPGSEVPVHFHTVDYCSIVVEGSIEVTRRVYQPGSMRFVRANTAYGPLKAGPEGCTVIDFFAGGSPDKPVETHFIERAESDR